MSVLHFKYLCLSIINLNLKKMKKIDFKSMLIGFLSCALLIILSGSKTVEPNPIGGGKYDMISHNGELFLLDSSTSVVYVLRNNAINRFGHYATKNGQYEWKWAQWSDVRIGF